MAERPQPNAENRSLAELETAMYAAASARSRDRRMNVIGMIAPRTGECFAYDRRKTRPEDSSTFKVE